MQEMKKLKEDPKYQTDGVYKDYLNSLPNDYKDFPSEYTTDDIDYLQGSKLQELIHKRNDHF